jgi:hypothetical protein
MAMIRPPRRRRCPEPLARADHDARHAAATRATTPLLQQRIRCVCRHREDFTGRGFGLERLRQAR